LLKSKIKTLKREATLVQKALSIDKVKILSLEAKVHKLKGKLKDIDLEYIYYDLDIMGGVIEKLAKINTSVMDDLKEINFLRLELEQVNEDFSSKKYTIECMKKGIESSNSIFKWEIDILSSG